MQLINNIDQMRAGCYEYLLAIDKELVVISWDGSAARLLETGAWQNFSRDMITDLARHGAARIAPEQQPFRWADAPYDKP